jgi:hypothetical protein
VLLWVVTLYNSVCDYQLFGGKSPQDAADTYFRNLGNHLQVHMTSQPEYHNRHPLCRDKKLAIPNLVQNNAVVPWFTVCPGSRRTIHVLRYVCISQVNKINENTEPFETIRATLPNWIRENEKGRCHNKETFGEVGKKTVYNVTER